MFTDSTHARVALPFPLCAQCSVVYSIDPTTLCTQREILRKHVAHSPSAATHQPYPTKCLASKLLPTLKGRPPRLPGLGGWEGLQACFLGCPVLGTRSW